jgi:hypothetical protein
LKLIDNYHNKIFKLNYMIDIYSRYIIQQLIIDDIRYNSIRKWKYDYKILILGNFYWYLINLLSYFKFLFGSFKFLFIPKINNQINLDPRDEDSRTMIIWFLHDYLLTPGILNWNFFWFLSFDHPNPIFKI